MKTTATVFFDLETGGVTPEHPDIQLAAVAVRGWQEVEAFEGKIQFDIQACDAEALALNSYDRETWQREARPERLVVRAFKDFLRKYACITLVSKRTNRPYSIARLAGHNAARFDAPRLVAMFRRHDEFLPADAYRPLDTMQLALWRMSEANPPPADFKLGTLATELGISTEGAHDALADVRMTVRVARALIGGGLA